jgi:hypothetical protein
VYKLVPLVLSVLQFLLQFGCMATFDAFDPQRVQYELLAKHVHSVIGDDAGADWVGTSRRPPRGSSWRQSVTTGFVDSVHASSKGFQDILRLFFRDPLYCFFSGIEVFTVVYVWMELTFSPVSCGNQFRLSRLYYPMILTVLDFGKLNFYVALRSWRRGQLTRAASSLLNLQIFFLYVVFSIILAFVFVGGVIKAIGVAIARGLEWVLPGICSWCTGMNTGAHGAWPSAEGVSGAGASEGETMNAMHDSIYFKNWDDDDDAAAAVATATGRDREGQELRLADLELQTPRLQLQQRRLDEEESVAAAAAMVTE